MSARTAQAADACPDPSAHSKDAKLQNSASKAALLATNAQKANSNPLGADGKLSSASAAASLKYAQPHELPSFPSVGIDTGNSGNRAANLANANQKSFEHWKPELSSSASKAALLAHKDGGKLDLWQPSSSDTGLTAAGAAMGIKSSPQLDYGYTEDGRKKALLAATLSVSGRTKSPEKPAQKLYPDQENAQHNALNAASVANRPAARQTADYGPVSDPANEAARLSHGVNFNKAMYGEKPPVEIEVEEQRYQAALRASSISVAKQMQEVQQRKSEDQYYAGLVSDDKAHASRTGSKNTPDNIRAQALGYINLQEAAQKLAAERLKKLDPDGVLAYREHWGAGTYGETPKEKERETSPRAKLTSRAQRFLSSSRSNEDEAEFSSDDEADEAEAQKIRNQMRGINTELAEIDAKKRETDRAALLAAAQKSVKERMANMDERVFRETGKASPALMAEWEEKARAKAAANNEERMKNYGKVHIGGGQYMDQSELEAIAQKRMQPMLDEINESAEKQRARDVEIAQDVQQRKYQSDLEKAKDREEKAEKKRQKEDEKMQATFEKNQRKAEAAELKREQKAKEDAEKAKWKEFKESEKAQKRAEKEEAKRAKEAEKQAEKERKEESKASKAGTAAAVGAGAGAGAAAATEQHDHDQGHVSEAQPETSHLGEMTVDSTATRAAHDETTQDPPGVPTKFEDDAGVAAGSEPIEAETSEVATETPVLAAPVSKGKATETEPAHEQEDTSAAGEAEAAIAVAAATTAGAGFIPATEHTATEDETAPADASAASPDRQSKRRSFLEKFRRSKHEDEQSSKSHAAAVTASEERRKSSAEKSSEKGSEKSGFEFPSIRRKSKNQGREPGLLTKFKRAVNDPNEDHVPEGTSATEHSLKAVDKSELDQVDTGPSLLTKIKQTINDPGEAHNPQHGAATEHQLQSVKHSDEAQKVRGHSPSPEMSPVAEEETYNAGRKASVESQPFQEAKDRLDEEPITALPLTAGAAPRGSESKFHEEV